MIVDQTQAGRRDRYQNAVTKTLGRVNSVSYTQQGAWVNCKAHLKQEITYVLDPQTNRLHPVCCECVATFFPSVLEAQREEREETFICNYKLCMNECKADSKCMWCGKVYCSAHLSGGCCDVCDQDAARDGGDDEQERWERAARMSGS